MKRILRLLSVLLAFALIFTAIPVYADETDYVELQLDAETTVVANGYFKFTPSETADYVLYSYNNYYDDYYFYTYAYLYNSDMLYLDVSNTNDDNSFELRATLVEGVTYYYEVGSYEESEYKVELVKAGEATSVYVKNSLKGYVGETLYADYDFMPAYHIDEDVEFKIENVEIASVNEDGYITLLAVGNTTLTITSENGLTVTVPVTALEIPEIKPDDTFTVTPDTNGNARFKFIPDESGYYSFYSFDNVDGDVYADPYVDLYLNGEHLTSNDDDEGYNFNLIYKFEKGNTYCFYTRVVNSEYCDYKVGLKTTPLAEKLVINNKGIIQSGYVGTSVDVDFSYEPEFCANEPVTYITSNGHVFTVDGQGTVHYVAEGSAVLTVISESGLTDSVTITVRTLETLAINTEYSLTVSPEQNKEVYKFIPDETAEYIFYSYDNFDEDDYDLDVRCAIYDSNMEKLDSGDDEGEGNNYKLNIELSEGETYYFETSSYDDQDIGSYKFLVVKSVDATSIEAIPDKYPEGYPGDILCVGVDFLPEFSKSERYTLSSSDEDVARCEGTDVIFVSKGTATITVTTKNGLTDSFEVNVIDVPFINADTEIKIDASEKNYLRKFYFIPAVTGNYTLVVNGEGGYCQLTDQSGECLNGYISSQDTFVLNAGEVYLIDTKSNSYEPEDYSFYIKTVAQVEALEIISLPEWLEYYKGYEYFYDDGLKVRVRVDGKDYYWEPYMDNDIDGNIIRIDDVYDGNEYVNTKVVCGNKEATFKYVVKEIDIEKIELVTPPSDNVYYENINGYYSETDDGEEVFIYYTNYTYDTVIKIVYKDGKSENVTVEDGFKEYDIDELDLQHINPWEIGKENFITFSLLGFEVKVPITLLPNPIKSVTLNKAPQKKYVFGDMNTGFFVSDSYYPSLDLDGLEFTVNYTDETSKTFTYQDLRYGEINGIGLDWDIAEIYGPGNYNVCLNYGGHEMNFEIEIVESNVESIEILEKPTLSVYPLPYTTPLPFGTKLQINYTNGTNKIITATEDNVICKWVEQDDLFDVYIEVDGEKLGFYYEYLSPSSSKMSYFAHYKGNIAVIDVEMNDSYEDVSKLTTEDISWTGKDMSFEVTFEDGTRTVTFQKVYYTEREDDERSVIRGTAQIQYGYVDYQIIRYYDDTPDEIYLFGNIVNIRKLGSRGDVNGDGIENTSDLALLKKLIAGLVSQDDASIVAPDVDENNDGVTTSDLALLKKRIAGLA